MPQGELEERIAEVEREIVSLQNRVEALAGQNDKFLRNVERLEEMIAKIARLEERLDGMMRTLGILQTLLFALLTVLVSTAIKFLER